MCGMGDEEYFTTE